MNKKWAVVVGYGNRGGIYADYSLLKPDDLGISAVVDPNPFKLGEAKKKYGLSDDKLFSSFADFKKSGIYCDFVINSTMDQEHYKTAVEIINSKYDMLIEKPIVPNEEELRELLRLAKENNVHVFVCHVLRYTPFYKKIKEIILSGEIGEIVSMEMDEHVCLGHYLTSYVRGKWNSETTCGSSFLLAKCCHDMDLICWLNNNARPELVSSFGTRAQFVSKKAPEGSSDYCYNCKYNQTCQYDAGNLYINLDSMPFLVWDRLNKPLDKITKDEKIEFLKSDIYGKCAYKCGGDIVDRQNLIIQFDNGSCASFTLVSGSMAAQRNIHIIGTIGELEGRLEDDRIIVRTYDKFGDFTKKPNGAVTRDYGYKTKEFFVCPPDNTIKGGHFGGDEALMHDLLDYLNGDMHSISITSLSDSINGHLVVFAVEKARKTKQIVSVGAI